MKIKSKIHFIPLLFLFFAGCKPDSEYPPEPIIEFKDFITSGTKAKLYINFTDGDGDMGLRETDTYPPYDTSSIYFNNFFIVYEEKVNGNWEPGLDVNGNPVEFKYRIPYITPEGQNKALKGVIEVLIEPYYYDPSSVDSDTIRYRIKIVDRALHESNEVITEEIIVN